MNKIKLNLEKPVVFYPQLSRALGGALEALYVQQLYYWSDKGGRKDGWIYKTKTDIERETTITIRQQDRVRKNLEKKGILETKLMKANGSPTLHYKLNIGILQNVILEYDEMSDSNVTKSDIPLTESTTENTTDNITYVDKPQKISSESNISGEESSLDKDRSQKKVIDSLIDKFKEVNPSYKKLFSNKTERAAMERMVKEHGEDKVSQIIDVLPQTNQEQYAPVISTPYQLEGKMGNLIAFIKRKGSDKNKIGKI